VLDVGSCLGLFARWFNKQGADVDAVEYYKRFFNACRKLNEVKGTDVNFYRQDARDFLKGKGQKRLYDMIVCLSVIHNIAQAGDPKGAVETLQLLSEKAPTMFFDIGHENEGTSLEGKGLPAGLISEDPAEVEKYIRENTAYKKAEVLGREQEYAKRKLYKLTR
jgi:hypothetical protein